VFCFAIIELHNPIAVADSSIKGFSGKTNAIKSWKNLELLGKLAQ